MRAGFDGVLVQQQNGLEEDGQVQVRWWQGTEWHRPVACVGNGVGCIAGEAGAGAVVGGAAVERPDVGSNRAAAASAADSVSVSGVLTGGEGRCWNAFNRFGDFAVVKAAPLVGESSGSATSPGRRS